VSVASAMMAPAAAPAIVVVIMAITTENAQFKGRYVQLRCLVCLLHGVYLRYNE